MLHSAGGVLAYRMFGIDYYDALMLSGEHQIQEVRDLEKLRKLPEKEVVKVGIPYMDEMVKRLYIPNLLHACQTPGRPVQIYSNTSYHLKKSRKEVYPYLSLAKELTRRMLVKHRILIKDLSEKIRTGQYIRLAVRDEKDNNKLLAAFNHIHIA